MNKRNRRHLSALLSVALIFSINLNTYVYADMSGMGVQSVNSGFTDMMMEIVSANEINDINAVMHVTPQTYTGSEIIPDKDDISVTYDGHKVSSTYFDSITCSNNTDAGIADITVSFKGDYTGTLTGTFKIEKFDLKDAYVTGVNSEYTVSMIDPITIDPVVKMKEDGLVFNKNDDYTIEYLNDNSKPGIINYKINANTVSNSNITGAYAGKYEIKKIAVSQGTVEVIHPEFVYDGTEKKITSVVHKDTGTVLEYRIDYDVDYYRNIEPGNLTAYVEIIPRAESTYFGKYNKKNYKYYFTIQKANIDSVKIEASDVEYDGEKHDTISVNGLIRDKDYTIDFAGADQVNAGTVNALIKGKTNYTGSRSMSFNIKPIDASRLTLSGFKEYYAYTGSAIEPEFDVEYKGIKLEKGVDYKVEYANNVELGATASVSVTGLNRNVTKDSTKTVEFKIYKGVLDEDSTEVTGLENVVLVDGKATPSFVVKHDGVELTEGVDYTYSYEGDLTKVGTATVHITGKGAYGGTLSIVFSIKEKDPDDLSDSSISATLTPAINIYDMNEHTPKVTLKSGSKTLTEGVDFSVRYEDNVDAGTAYAIATGLGKYTGTRNIPFEIEERSIKEADFNYEKTHNYTTGEIEPEVEVSYNGVYLRERRDYALAYKDNINVGKGKIVVVGTGNYKDTATLEFDIVNPYAEDPDKDKKKDDDSKKDTGGGEDNNNDNTGGEDEWNGSGSISSDVPSIREAIRHNYGSVSDTVALRRSGNKYLVSGLSGNDAVVTVAKGNKFTIEDGSVGSFESSDKKAVSVSKKGVVKARKASSGTKITYTDSKGGKVTLTVNVIDPRVISGKKRTIKLSRGANIDVEVEIPLNAFIEDIKNVGTAKISSLRFNEAGRLEIRGNAENKGLVKMNLRVNNKKYLIKLRVK